MVNNIKFVGIARIQDRTLVAAYSADDGPSSSKSKLENVARKVLSGSRVTENVKLSINDPNLGTVHFDRSDTQIVVLTITTHDYPQRVAFSFLTELKTTFSESFGGSVGMATSNSLTKSAHKTIDSIVKKFDDVSAVDKLAGVQSQVNEVKVVMQDNIERMLEREEKLESIEHKTESMRDQAQRFQQNSTKLKRHFCRQHAKTVAILVLVVAIILAIVIGVIVGKNKDDE